MPTPPVLPNVTESIVVFADLRSYHRHICAKLSPAEIFNFLSAYYAVAQRALDASGGKIIKFMGDSILLLFPDRAITALQNLKTVTDSFLSQQGYDSRLYIKAHVGPVAAGEIGNGALKRFDIAGQAVNQTALLPDDEWSVSEELQRRIKK